MIRQTLMMFGAVVLGSALGLGLVGVSAQAPQLPAGVQSSFDTEEATVLKVFSAQDGEHRFVAYMVKWKDSEVIVSDALARSDFEVGDTISFMAQKITLPQPPMGVSSLSFTLTSPPRAAREAAGPGADAISPEEQRRNMKIVGGNLAAARTERERFYALGRAAKNALKAGDAEQGRELATELELLTPKYRKDWNYGNAIQDASQVLGRIALAAGDVEEAKRRLLASADSKGSPQMNSFGPNMQLAKELLAKGERDVVLEYFGQCGTFWKMGTDRLTTWAETVRTGGTPEFGANLEY